MYEDKISKVKQELAKYKESKIIIDFDNWQK